MPNFLDERNSQNSTLIPKSAFHIDSFKNKIKDLLRPNLFKILISVSGEMEEKLLYLVKEAVFPSYEIKAYEFKRAGKTLYIPTSNVDYSDLNVTFYVDDEVKTIYFFKKWQENYILNKNRNILFPKTSFNAEVYLVQYDSDLEPKYIMKFLNCWPSKIGELKVSQENDQISEITIDFKFSETISFV